MSPISPPWKKNQMVVLKSLWQRKVDFSTIWEACLLPFSCFTVLLDPLQKLGRRAAVPLGEGDYQARWIDSIEATVLARRPSRLVGAVSPCEGLLRWGGCHRT